MGEMTDKQIEALRDAVNIARNQQIRTVRELRSALIKDKHTLSDINIALQFWVNQYRGK